VVTAPTGKHMPSSPSVLVCWGLRCPVCTQESSNRKCSERFW